MRQNIWKMTETLAYGYSSQNTQWELSNEYQHDRVYMVFKDLCVILLWTKVYIASALEVSNWHQRQLPGLRIILCIRKINTVYSIQHAPLIPLPCPCILQVDSNTPQHILSPVITCLLLWVYCYDYRWDDRHCVWRSDPRRHHRSSDYVGLLLHSERKGTIQPFSPSHWGMRRRRAWGKTG